MRQFPGTVRLNKGGIVRVDTEAESAQGEALLFIFWSLLRRSVEPGRTFELKLELKVYYY